MTMTDTLNETVTTSMRNISLLSDERFAPVVKEVERQILFTDVPCGAMKFNGDEEAAPSSDRAIQGGVQGGEESEVTQGLMKFCGTLERAFCFSDLQDITEETIISEDKLTKSMLSLPENTEGSNAISLLKDAILPAVEPADTDSCSDDSAEKEKEATDPTAADATTTIIEEENVKQEEQSVIKDAVTEAVAEAEAVTDEAVAAPVAAVEEAVMAAVSTVSLPAANALQAAKNKVNDGKPMNALQAAKAASASMKASKKNGKKEKKSWGLFRKSSKKQAVTAV